MKEHIVYRAYQKKDHEALANIIRNIWQYDEFYSPSIVRLLSEVYLNLCLIEQTYTQVAEINSKPIGIIMGYNPAKHRLPLKHLLPIIGSLIKLMLTKEGRNVIRFQSEMDRINKKLLANCGKDYQGEVSFFAVNPDYHGKGIGKELFRRLLQYMKEDNISNFYLFTDTSCNYGFYEGQNMRRCGAENHSFQLWKKNLTITFFIYEYSG